MDLNNKTVLMVIAFMGYQEHEYTETRRVLEEAKANVRVASLEKGEATSHMQRTTYVDYKINEVKVDDFDAVIFVGGEGMVALVDYPELIELAKEFHGAGKITAAICIAPMILANAGLLKNKTATVWEGAEEKLIAKKVNYTGAAVEQDENLITGNGPTAATKFGETLVKALSN